MVLVHFPTFVPSVSELDFISVFSTLFSYRNFTCRKMADGFNLELVAAATRWAHGEPLPRPAYGHSLFPH
jgi:hypothetical protein